MSDLEDRLLLQIRAAELPEPERGHQFLKSLGRRWAFDFAWVNRNHPLAVEVEGGTWGRGGHVRGKHFESDAMKYSLASICGWVLIRVNNHMIADGRALALIQQALRPTDSRLLMLAGWKCEKCLTAEQKRKLRTQGEEQ